MTRYPIRAKLIWPISLLVDDKWQPSKIVTFLTDDDGVFHNEEDVVWERITGEVQAYGVTLGPHRYEMPFADHVGKVKRSTVRINRGDLSVVIPHLSWSI